MKTSVFSLLLLPALIAALNSLPAGRVAAQTFTTLHSFTATRANASGVYTNSDGAVPEAGLITNSSGTTLYGTAVASGSAGYGTVFAVNTDGTGFTNLYRFTPAPYSCCVTDVFSGDVTCGCYTNSDGAYPVAGLILSGSTLYGTAVSGGSAGYGTVFAVNTNGTGFTNLHSFTAPSSVYPPSNSDGANPVAGLILSGHTLYGTAFGGGSSALGTVFAVNTDGTGFTNLHSFTNGGSGGDGAGPVGGLILSGNTLYGAAIAGGNTNAGTVFAVNTDGTGFTNLHSFNFSSDGANPVAGLILSGNTLYGTALNGGSSALGTVFAVNTNGTDFTTLHSFTPTTPSCCYTDDISGDVACLCSTNGDGAYPRGGLILSGNTLYGTASASGSSGNGTVFAINTDGTGFTNLHSFTATSGSFLTNSDGAGPVGGLILSGNTLYGTAGSGGSSGNGTVFSLSLPPLPPAEQINGLIALVQGLDLQSGTANSLIVKLQGAANALERGNLEAACSNLGALLNEVNAQTGKWLTAAQAGLLIAEATRLRAVLGCR